MLDTATETIESAPYSEKWSMHPGEALRRDYGVDGQIGLELHPQEFIDKLVNVFCDVREVLNTTGSVWVKMAEVIDRGPLH